MLLLLGLTPYGFFAASAQEAPGEAPLLVPLEPEVAPTPVETMAAPESNPSTKAIATPTPAAPPSPENKPNTEDEDEDGVLAYEKISPSWAFGLRLAFSNFPISGALGDSFQLFGEYMLPATPLGVFSLGIHFGSFPLYVPETGLPYPVYENALAGAQVRYQLKFSKSQFLVPTAAFEWEAFKLKEHDTDDAKLSGTSFGLSLGLMMSLNGFDRGTANEAYDNIGLIHSYFMFELRSATITTKVFDASGTYWFLGTRLEFE